MFLLEIFVRAEAAIQCHEKYFYLEFSSYHQPDHKPSDGSKRLEVVKGPIFVTLN